MNRKPNFLIIQADQLAARALAAYGNKVCKTPAIDRIAAAGTVFENTICNFPLCGPSRGSMMSGLLAFNAKLFDNGAEYAAGIPTFAHYLRILGYQTCLSGKMHFVGPDQLHGFEERLITDIYPSDFNWAANWTKGTNANEPDRLLAAAGEVNGLLHSGVYNRTVQMDYDDDVCFRAVRKIHDFARSDDTRPFCLVTSFTHPHDPFIVTQDYWDRYDPAEIDMPHIGRLPREALDPHSRRIYDHVGIAQADMSEDDVRLARHGYYAAISYIDDQVAKLHEALEVAGVADNTVVIVVSDHGEALGERGLWFKRSFYDAALKVPLIVSIPGRDQAPRCAENAALVDLLPTLVDLADPADGLSGIEAGYDGRSLVPATRGEPLAGPNIVYGEMAADGLTAPAVAIIENQFKYIHCDTDPPMLFDLAADPHETRNLCGTSEAAGVEARMAAMVHQKWDLGAITAEVLETQRRRRAVDRAHMLGAAPSWDYDVFVPGRTAYFRGIPVNPSASNYASNFDIRLRPDTERPNPRIFP
ncbi:MAG: choline-sulfatase [Pseudomonadota bacterium]